MQEYEDAKLELKQEGFNIEGIFDAEVPTATKLRRKETEEEQVKALVERKGGFSASAIFTNVGTVCVTSTAIIKAQRIQLKKKAKENTDKIQKKTETSDKHLLEAQVVNEKNSTGEKLSTKVLKTIIMYVLSAAKCTDSPSQYTMKEQINTRLSKIDKYWSEYILVNTDTEVVIDAEVDVDAEVIVEDEEIINVF